MKRYIKADNDIFDRISGLNVDPFGSERDRELLAMCMSDPELLEIYMYDPSESVRRTVASNPAASAACLEKLSKDRNDIVRMAVARNMSAPASVLSSLATDPMAQVRSEVASNPKIPPEVCRILANDSYYETLATLARNDSTDADTLDAIVHNIPTDLPELDIVHLAFWIAGNDNTSAETLDYLLSIVSDSDILERIAMHKNIAPETLDILSYSPNTHVRWRVAFNDNTSNDTLKRLCEDEYHNTRDVARVALERRGVSL